jgi:hypothetical protein
MIKMNIKFRIYVLFQKNEVEVLSPLPPVIIKSPGHIYKLNVRRLWKVERAK